MEFYAFVRSFLAWTASVACLFPINVPILFFAHRIREGQIANEDDRMDGDEAWKRAGLGASVLAVATAAPGRIYRLELSISSFFSLTSRRPHSCSPCSLPTTIIFTASAF